MMDTGFITPLDFGAAGDGATDDGPELQLALNASDYSVIDLAGKTYATNQQLTLTRSNVTIRNGTIKYTGTNKSKFSILKIYGTDTTATALTVASPVNIGDYVVRVNDSSTISVGDWVKIANHTETSIGSTLLSAGSRLSMQIIPYGAETFERSKFFSDMQKVIANDSSTEDLTLLDPILGKLTTNSTVTKLTSVLENINIINVQFQGNALGTSVVAVDGFANASDETVTVTTTAAHNLTTGDYVYFGNGDSDGSGFEFIQHVFGQRVVASTPTSTTFTYTSCGSTSVGTDGGTGAECLSGLNRALEIEYCNNVNIHNCTFNDCPGGILELNYVNNCTVDSNLYMGPAFPEGDLILLGNTTPYVTISNNTFHCGRGGNGIYSPTSSGPRKGTTYEYVGGNHCHILNNRFTGIRGTSVHLQAGFNRAKIDGNHISQSYRFNNTNNGADPHLEAKYHIHNIYTAAIDTEITNNHIENISNNGIIVDNGMQENAVLTGDNTNANIYADPQHYMPYFSVTILNNKLFAHRDYEGAGNRAINILHASFTTDGLPFSGGRISNNLMYGFTKGIKITGKNDTDFSNSLVNDNIFIVLAKDTSDNEAYGLDFTRDGNGTIRWGIHNNIFDIKWNGSFTNTKHTIYSHDFLNCAINNNIMNWSGTPGSKAHIYFDDPTDSSSFVQNASKCSLLGNVFSGAGGSSALNDISVGVAGANQSYSIGQSLGATSADYGERYGLNVWSFINAAGWPGPD